MLLPINLVAYDNINLSCRQMPRRREDVELLDDDYTPREDDDCSSSNDDDIDGLQGNNREPNKL